MSLAKLSTSTPSFTFLSRTGHRRLYSTGSPQQSKYRRFDSFQPEIQSLATRLESARSKNHQIPTLTSTTHPGLTQDQSYSISSAIRALRCEQKDDTVIGRKIGFTNKSIWPEYNVDRSNWSYMYRSSIVDLTERKTESGAVECALAEFSNLEPKIEPEIVLGLRSKVEPGMSDEEILSCMRWIAHGFEIVVSVFPGWKFTAADTTAAFALHGKLLLGPRKELPLGSASSEETLRQLEHFKVRLYRNDELADEGAGSNVLGSPIKALRHLAELLKKDEVNVLLAEDEVVTTGTLTKALSINEGDTWRTEIEGLDIAPLEVAFKM